MRNSKTVALAIIIPLIGCSTFRPMNRPSQQPVIDQCLDVKKDYRVAFRDGRKADLKGWQFRCREGGYFVLEKADWRFYPESEISHIEEKKFSTGKTIGLTAGIVGGAALVGFAVILGILASADED